MSACASCGSQLSDDSSLCRHHHLASEEGWAAGNRILCDLLHRGVEPSRLSPDQREEPGTSDWPVAGPSDAVNPGAASRV